MRNESLDNPDEDCRQASGLTRLERIIKKHEPDVVDQQDLFAAYLDVFRKAMKKYGRAVANEIMHDCADYLEANAQHWRGDCR